MKYVDKTLLFRIIYGFRIEIYDMKENRILTVEASEEKNTVRTDPSHYDAIATPVSTSIPQIRRDVCQTFLKRPALP